MAQESRKFIFSVSYPNKLVMQSKQSKVLKLRSNKFIDGENYCVVSNPNSISLIIPTISTAINQSLDIYLRNDSRKKIVIKRDNLIIDFEILRNTDEIYDFEKIDEVLKDISEISSVPIPYYNCQAVLNKGFYCNRSELKIKNYFKNKMHYYNFTAQGKINETDDDINDEVSFEHLAEMEGYDITKEPLPFPSVDSIVRDSIQKDLDEDLRKFLIDLFLKYPTVVAVHNWDCGILSDYKGDPILLDIPLK